MFRQLITICMVVFVAVGTLYSQSYSGGSGTLGDPYQISTKADLKYLCENSAEWSKSFTQTADIEFLASDFQSGGDFYNSGNGFIPIGTSTTKFTGWYLGNEHTIDGLFIDRSSTDYIGFFGYTSGSNISDLGLTNVEITGAQRTGGLVGTNYNTEINRCFTTGSVTGTARVGGLIGHNDYGKVYNSYSRTSITGTSLTGGFVGLCEGTSGYGLDKCYSSGSVTGGNGFLGAAAGSPVTNCFWDTEISGQSSSAGGTAKTTTEMKTLSTFTDELTDGLTTAWDFETNPNDDASNNDIWDIDLSATINSGYPYLAWQDGTDRSLPVTLSYFVAKSVKEGGILLEWSTQSEIENLGFFIERRRYQEKSWQEIASYKTHTELRGQGSSTTATNYAFLDKSVMPGESYDYRLADISYNGQVKYHPLDSKIEYLINSLLPSEMRMLQNYPNPFNPSTTIRYGLPEVADATLTIFDLTGREVMKVVNANQAAGYHAVHWNGMNATGNRVSTGVYFCRIDAGSYSSTIKMLMVK